MLPTIWPRAIDLRTNSIRLKWHTKFILRNRLDLFFDSWWLRCLSHIPFRIWHRWWMWLFHLWERLQFATSSIICVAIYLDCLIFATVLGGAEAIWGLAVGVVILLTRLVEFWAFDKGRPSPLLLKRRQRKIHRITDIFLLFLCLAIVIHMRSLLRRPISRRS